MILSSTISLSHYSMASYCGNDDDDLLYSNRILTFMDIDNQFKLYSTFLFTYNVCIQYCIYVVIVEYHESCIRRNIYGQNNIQLTTRAVSTTTTMMMTCAQGFEYFFRCRCSIGREFYIAFHPLLKGPSSSFHSSVTRVCIVRPSFTTIAVVVFKTVSEYFGFLKLQPFHPTCPHRVYGKPFFVSQS